MIEDLNENNKETILDTSWSWTQKVFINETYVRNSVKQITDTPPFLNECEAAWLLKAVSCVDLTTLAGDDTFTNVSRLCVKATRPISEEIIQGLAEKFGDNCESLNRIKTAAVCVYPARVDDAVSQLKRLNVDMPVASVATGFPSGQYPLNTRLDEIRFCVAQGAKEIDVVLDRSLVLAHKWDQLYSEVKEMKNACQQSHLKTILAVGECGSFENIYKASMVAMLAGSDFIKTSTGKESVNATLPVGIVMCRAIRNYFEKTGRKVGLKPAGGLKTNTDAINWLMLVKTELGDDWLDPRLFRIGASSLLQSIEERLHKIAFNEVPLLDKYKSV